MKRILFVLLALCAFTSAHADIILREDTASQIEPIGPFVDTSGDPVTNLTIANTDVMLSKAGAAFAAKNSGGCTHDSGAPGMYLCTFNATDSSTVGGLTIYVKMTGALPVYHTARVVEEAVFDACCAASAAPATPATIWSYSGGRTITGGTVTTNSDKTGYSLSSTQTFSNTGTWTGNLSGSVGSVTGNVGGNVTGSVGSVATGGISTGSFAAGAINAAAIATDAIGSAELAADAIGTSELAASAVTEIQTGLATSAALTTLDGKVDALDLVADAIKAKTDNLNFTVTGQVDANTESVNGAEVFGLGTSASPWNGE